MAYLMAALVIVPGSFDELDWDSPSVSTCLKQFTKTSPWAHFCFVQIPPNYRNTIINADCLAAAGKLPLATGPPASGRKSAVPGAGRTEGMLGQLGRNLGGNRRQRHDGAADRGCARLVCAIEHGSPRPALARGFLHLRYG